MTWDKRSFREFEFPDKTRDQIEPDPETTEKGERKKEEWPTKDDLNHGVRIEDTQEPA